MVLRHRALINSYQFISIHHLEKNAIIVSVVLN